MGCFSDTANIFLCLFQGIFIFFLVKYKPLKYNNVYIYPDWGYGIGWMMALSSMICIPLWICIKLWKEEGTFIEVRCILGLTILEKKRREYESSPAWDSAQFNHKTTPRSCPSSSLSVTARKRHLNFLRFLQALPRALCWVSPWKVMLQHENSLWFWLLLRSLVVDLAWFVEDNAATWVYLWQGNQRQLCKREGVSSQSVKEMCVCDQGKIMISIFSNFLEIQEADYT